MSAPLLELHDATVILGDTRVLDRLTLSIHEGDHTAILGPNGAGKSTLMKLLTLQLYPVAPAGQANGVPPIRVLGRDRWDVFALRSQLGIISADLHDRFVQGNSSGVITGLDAVLSGFFATFGVFAHQRVTDAMRAQAREALDRVDAARLAAQPVATMSTGEARRILIARALVHRPEALVLDEPTRGLDVLARHHFLEQVRALARDGVTLLLVTHHVDEIIPEIDRVILLKGGRVAGDGPKIEMLTGVRLGDVFGSSLEVETAGGYYNVRVAGA
ncbi:MAG: ATP-binding cassette domain-containing protein [Acidobacteria bacterium]|nr:ATP-binding cassette domain-containing protein [Acidobacteriota bacterium]